ncbi:hypothetical protein Q5W10_12320, partial [Waltera intestinalis]
ESSSLFSFIIHEFLENKVSTLFIQHHIESDYAYCVKNGYKIVTDGIEGIAGFWDNGIRYFKIASPTGEQFEFCQIL